METSLITAGFRALTATVQATKAYSKFKRFWNGLCFNKKKVLVIGESGSGKSQFLATIQNRGLYIEHRTVVDKEIKMTLADGHVVVFVDVPGHHSSQEIRQRRINELNREKYDGIINVVCYGYQITDAASEEQVFEAGTDKVKAGFLNDNRKLELSQLDEWIGAITKDTGIKWVLTLINKADLWDVDKKIVTSYYEEGEYDKKISKLKPLAKCIVVPYCSVIGNFCNRHLSQIDEKGKLRLHNRMKENLLELILEAK